MFNVEYYHDRELRWIKEVEVNANTRGELIDKLQDLGISVEDIYQIRER